jgi:hypothetical protein
MTWTDIRTLGVEGRGWNESDVESFYDRLPARAKGNVPEVIWNLSKHSAGMHVRFVTNATKISARWMLRCKELAMNHMPATGVSGLDLYVKVDSMWRWLGMGLPSQFPCNQAELVDGLDGQRHELMQYLPLFNGVDSVEIGLPEDASLEPAPRIIAKPMCFYGTSILHGGCASRAGMAWPSIVGRRLGRVAINLGFSGYGRMETQLAEIQRELDVCVYVLDCLPNMHAGLVDERLVPFVRTLRETRPLTPIVLVEKPHYPAWSLRAAMRENTTACNAACRRAYDALKVQGDDNLHYVLGDDLYGDDGEATVDGVHATDVGFLRMAAALEPLLARLLKDSP